MKVVCMILILRQLATCCSGFLAAGLLIGAKSTAILPLVIMMLGFITYSLGLLGIYEYLLFKIHYLNTSLRKLGRAAECLKTEDHKGNMKVRVRNLLWDIEELEPISGYGLFNVDRTTLTSTVSVMVTYLIILVQFKQAALNT